MDECYEKITPNFRLEITKIGTKEKGIKSVRFYSTNTGKSILKSIDSNIHIKKGIKTCKINIILNDFEKKKTYKKLFNYYDWSIDDIMNSVLKSVFKVGVDVRNTRYNLKIQNNTTPQIDTKTYSFNSHLNFKDLFYCVKRDFLEKIRAIDDEINFEFQKKVKTTHYVTLRRSGTSIRRKMNSKSFSVNMMNYSSGELINLLRGIEENE